MCKKSIKIKKVFSGLMALGVIFMLGVLTAQAEVPRLINYQGKLTDTGGRPVTDGNYAITFKLYTQLTGGSPLWTEANPTVPVSNGLFNVILGSLTTLNLDFRQGYYLGIQVAADPEMTPRQRLTSVGYALRAEITNSLAPDMGPATFTSNSNTPAITGSGTNIGVYGKGQGSMMPDIVGVGVYGESTTYGYGGCFRGPTGLLATGWMGIEATSSYGSAVYGESMYGNALFGKSGFGGTFYGLKPYYGVLGMSENGSGICGYTGTNTAAGVEAWGGKYGVYSKAQMYGGHFEVTDSYSFGVVGSSSGYGGTGVSGYGRGQFGTGVYGEGTSIGVTGISDSYSGAGVSGNGYGEFTSGVNGYSSMKGAGVYGHSSNGRGVQGSSDNNVGGFFSTGSYTTPALYVYKLCWGATGSLIEAYSDNNLRFKVHNNGNVTADGNFTGGGADFAEIVTTEEIGRIYEPGDILVLGDKEKTFKLSSQPYSTSVAGVYSTKPGFIGTTKPIQEIGKNEIPLAITGIVPCKVSCENGVIKVGDLLTTSATPGYAMKATEPKIGTILGKALQSLNFGTGMIEVLITLQ